MGIFVQDRRPAKRYVTTLGAVALGILLGLMAIVVVQNIAGAWPDSVPDPETTAAGQLDQTIQRYILWPAGQTTGASWDRRLLVLALWFGALGSMLHAGASFVRFAGNRQLISSWVPWYLVRPTLGAGLAVIFYVVVRAGLVTAGGAPADVSHFSVSAFAAMVGLFTENATKKLAELFETLFAPRDEKQDADPLTEADTALPRIDHVTPTWIQAGHLALPMSLTGTNISDEVVLKLNGEETQYERRNGRLDFVLPPKLRSRTGTVEVALSAGGRDAQPKRIVVSR